MVALRVAPRLGGIALVALMGACAPAAAPGGDGMLARQGYWRPDDRVLVTDFRDLGGVASDRRFVYAAGAQGVLIYDHRFGRWEAPLTVEDGFPVADPPVDLAVDRFAGVLWMVTRTGALWSHAVTTNDEWRWAGGLPGAPPVRLATHEGSLWARTGSGWYQTTPGMAPTPSTPPAAVRADAISGLERLERDSPSFRAAGPTLTVDEYLRRYAITGAAPSPDPGAWWLATRGGGLYAYDDRMLDARPLRFGTVGRGVSALAEVEGGGGYWFGGDGRSPRRGVAYSDRELQRWAWHEAGIEGAPAGPVHAVVPTEAGVFVGAQDGLYRLDGDRWERMTDQDDLPSTVVRSLAPGWGAVWAATDRGLVRVTVTSDGRMSAVRVDGTGGVRIGALAAVDSILWMGTDRGLWSLDMASGTLAQPSIRDPRLRGPIAGVAWTNGILYVLAESTLLAYDGASWTAPLVGASMAGIGRPTHLAARAGVVWIAGTAGALAIDPVSGMETLLSVPRDIPEGPIRQVMPVAGGVWFATPAGALLIRQE